jgi:hypothetical protein
MKLERLCELEEYKIPSLAQAGTMTAGRCVDVGRDS